jgi:hypothetical protein
MFAHDDPDLFLDRAESDALSWRHGDRDRAIAQLLEATIAINDRIESGDDRIVMGDWRERVRTWIERLLALVKKAAEAFGSTSYSITVSKPVAVTFTWDCAPAARQ